ncbi:hypothetical protein [Synechocystis sp. LKSZ1]|uniref:hypothetical protein n=1 Tax=Synechocystis sp. LKSZ1 TaxID=3144951 RepID=UPI00336BE99A
MANPSQPYQSRLFNFINRQSLKWRDRLGVTFRQLKIAAEWSVQALVAPLYWLMHPQEWLDPQLGPPTTSVALPYLSEPPVDQPLQEILTTIEPWLGLTPSTTEPDALPLPQIVLPGHFFENIRQQLADTSLTPEERGEVPPPLALPASPLARLGNHLKQSLSQGQAESIVIHGLACQYRSRQLVLVTTDNEVLDVLSPSQQQALSTAIRQRLANFYYQRRVQWALAQKSVGLIPLTFAQGTAPLPPLDWLWQGLRWWQGQALSLSSSSSALAPIPKFSISSAPLVRPVQTNLSMAWPHPPALAQQLQSQWQGLAKQTQQWLMVSSPALTPTEVDPFQIRVILQAAIDYFFGSGQRPTALTPESSASTEPWLAWDDLFVESSPPVPLLETSGSLTQTPSSPSDLAPSPSANPKKPMANPPQLSRAWELPDLWAEAVPAAPELPAAPAVLAWHNPWQTELETAFDWIETEARPVGYQRHFLEYLLAGLDQLVFGLEAAVQKLGEWLRGTFWPWLKAVIDEGRRA